MIRREALRWSVAAAMMIGCATVIAADKEQGKERRAPNAASKGDSKELESSKSPDATTSGKGKAPDGAPLVFKQDLQLTPPHAYLVAVMRPAKMSALDGVRDVPGAD